MSGYRQILQDPPEVVTSQKLVIYDLTGQFKFQEKENACPFCRYLKYKFRSRVVEFLGVCSPAKRLYKGWWPFRRYCTINGWHDHFQCFACHTEWVVMDHTKTPFPVAGVSP